MLMQHGEHGVFSGGKYGLGRLPLGSHLGSAEVGDRVRRIMTQGRLRVHDPQWCIDTRCYRCCPATARIAANPVDPDNDWACAFRRSAPVT